MVQSSRRPLAALLASAALLSAGAVASASSASGVPTSTTPHRVTATNTFAFQNIGHETNGLQVMRLMRAGVIKRSTTGNRFYDFAEIGEGKTAADAREHNELKHVFGPNRWVDFRTDDPVKNLATSAWHNDGTTVVPLAGGRGIKKCSPPRHLIVGKWHWGTNPATKLAVVNSHFTTGAYNKGMPACKRNNIAKRLWDRSWIDLQTEVRALRGDGYDVVVTADFNRRTRLPYLVQRTVVAEHRGPDWILAAPIGARRVVVKRRGYFATRGESFHPTIWSTVTFTDK